MHKTTPQRRNDAPNPYDDAVARSRRAAAVAPQVVAAASSLSRLHTVVSSGARRPQPSVLESGVSVGRAILATTAWPCRVDTITTAFRYNRAWLLTCLRLVRQTKIFLRLVPNSRSSCRCDCPLSTELGVSVRRSQAARGVHAPRRYEAVCAWSAVGRQACRVGACALRLVVMSL